MKTILRTAAAVAAISLTAPAFAFTIWPDIDFQWYANVGRYDTRAAPADVQPPARAGYIWAPAHRETRGEHQAYVAAHWVIDDYDAQLAIYNHPEYVVTAR